MKLLKLIFLVLVFLQVANAAMAQEARVDEQGNVVIKYISGSEEVAGQIQVLRKGTRLFHWGEATPEQARSWNNAGRISPELLAHLRLGDGYAGGGFYVSRDILDSQNYGNTLVVIELPKDINIVNSSDGFKWSRPTLGALEKLGVSAAVVPNSRTWMNIIDAEALTKEFVADADFFKKNLPSKIQFSEDLKELFEKFPELKEDPVYKKLAQDTLDLMTEFDSKDSKIASSAFLKILEKGSLKLKTYAFTRFSFKQDSPIFSEKTIDALLKMIKERISHGAHAISALKIAASIDRPINRYLYSKISDIPEVLSQVAHDIRQQLPPEQASAIFQEAQFKLGNKTPPTVQSQINDMKAKGLWNPPMMCHKIFN